MTSKETTNKGLGEHDMSEANRPAQGYLSIARCRQITCGLAFFYFIWLAFLAWVAFKVLTA